MTHPREICAELTYLYSQMTAFLMSSLIKQQYEQYKQLQSPSLGMKCPVVQIPAIVIRTHTHTHTHKHTHTQPHTPTHTHQAVQCYIPQGWSCLAGCVVIPCALSTPESGW